MNARPSVVITGAGGFLGGYTARWFASRRYPVTATVRRSPPGAFGARVAVVAGDLRQRGLLPDRFDVLIHCAAETPSRCPDHDQLRASNVESAEAVFTQARAAGARAVVFLSSMSVYGEINVPVVTEALRPVNPDPYGMSKAQGEALLEAATTSGLPSGLSIRLPGTVGHGSHDNFLSEALPRARAGETLTVRHPSALFNNIVFAGDLARFLEMWVQTPRPGYGVTNLAASEPITFRELFDLLFTRLGLPPRVRYETTGKPPFLISTERARAYGYHAPTVVESVSAFVHDCTCADRDVART